MNKLLKEYVETVAGEPVSTGDALSFCKGLEDFYRETFVSYDINENGYLKTKTEQFDSFRDAYEFARQLKSFGKPVIE